MLYRRSNPRSTSDTAVPVLDPSELLFRDSDEVEVKPSWLGNLYYVCAYPVPLPHTSRRLPGLRDRLLAAVPGTETPIVAGDAAG
jgi:hypothetical protein